MAIRHIGSAWQEALKETPASTRNGAGYDRFYIDFRGVDYPAYAGSPTFTLETAGALPGSHYLSGGFGKYLLPLPSTLTIDILLAAGFAYDTGSDQPLWSWYMGANEELSCYYDQATDTVRVKWICNGTARYLVSSALNGTSLPLLRRVTVVFDLAGTSALYLNGGVEDTTWSGATDTKNREMPWFEIRALRGSMGAWNIGMVRVFPGYAATAALVAADFHTVRNEEICWLLNGEALGRTRCNITGLQDGHTLTRATEGPNGAVANQLRLMLMSQFGEFADDQYAAFDAANSVYNGTAAQAYMMRRCRVMAESWYGGLCEPVFVGRVDEGLFSRRTDTGDISRVTVDCLDKAAELGNRFLRRGRFWEDYDLAAADGMSSLFHEIAHLGTQAEVYNYAGKSDHPVVDVGSTWLTTGGTLSEVGESAPITSANTGQFANSSGGTKILYQIIEFASAKLLNLGETWTFGVWLKSAAGAAASIRLAEYDSTTLRDSNSAVYSLAAGDNYELVEVTHTLTDASSDRLRIEIDCADGETILVQGVMLVQMATAPKWLVINGASATGGVFYADDAQLGTYDTCGIIVSDISIVHPWARVERDTDLWSHLKELGDAALAAYMGFDEGGALRLDARLADGYSDPSSLDTIDGNVAMAVESSQDGPQANKLRVHGVKILKETNARLVWDAQASRAFPDGKGFGIYVDVADGAQIPDPATYGEFVAHYGEGATIGRWVVSKR